MVQVKATTQKLRVVVAAEAGEDRVATAAVADITDTSLWGGWNGLPRLIAGLYDGNCFKYCYY